MGDVIHTLPALTDAQRAIPGIRFDWVVEEGFAEIPTWHPAVDQVIPLALRRWRKNLRAAWRSGEFGAFRQRLREGQYDLCIDAQGLLKSAVFSPYVNAPVAGLDRASAREPLASLFYQHRFSVAWRQHAVERVRQLFAHSLGYTLPDGLGEWRATTAPAGIDRARCQPVVPAQHNLADQALAGRLLATTRHAGCPATSTAGLG